MFLRVLVRAPFEEPPGLEQSSDSFTSHIPSTSAQHRHSTRRRPHHEKSPTTVPNDISAPCSLRSKGWSSTKGSGLCSWRYFRPGVDQRHSDLIEGVDYFDSEVEAINFACGWVFSDDLRTGDISETPPPHWKELKRPPESCFLGRGRRIRRKPEYLGY